MIIIIYNPASLIPVISNYDIWFIGPFFSACVDCQLSIVACSFSTTVSGSCSNDLSADVMML